MNELVGAWEERGERIGTDDGEVWVLDQPAARPDPMLDPILVLHGFPSSSFDWRHVLDAMSARRRVVLFDMLGFGLSDKPDRRYSIEMHADTAEAVARHCGLGSVLLTSHDMGNSVAGEVLARAGEDRTILTVTRRFMTNGSIYLAMAQLTGGQQLLSSLPDERLTESFAGENGEGFITGVAQTFAAGHQPDAAEMAAHWALMSRLDGHLLLPRTIRYLEDRRAREARYTGAIEAHSSPLGVVWGALDPVAVVAMTGQLLEARPDVDLEVLDDVGHWPMIEAPDRFTNAFSAMATVPD